VQQTGGEYGKRKSSYKRRTQGKPSPELQSQKFQPQKLQSQKFQSQKFQPQKLQLSKLRFPLPYRGLLVVRSKESKDSTPGSFQLQRNLDHG